MNSELSKTAQTEREAVAWPCSGCANHPSNAGDTGKFDRFIAALPATQQATPEPVGEVVAYREKLTGRLCEPDDTHRRKFPMCYEPLIRPAAAPAVPEVFALVPMTRQQLREEFHKRTKCTLGGDIAFAEQVAAVVEAYHAAMLAAAQTNTSK